MTHLDALGAAARLSPRGFVSLKKSGFIGLPNMNTEIADARDLLPVFSYSVEVTEPILDKCPNLQPQIIEILGSQPSLALELLRRSS